MRLLRMSLMLLVLASAGRLWAATDVWVDAKESWTNWGTSKINGTGTAAAPYYGDFDAVLGKLAENTTVHLSAGIFYTRGAEGSSSFNLKPGQRILGAGIDKTRLRYTHWTQSREVAILKGNNLSSLDRLIEISDLTVDAGADSGPVPQRKRMGAAIVGAGILRRVKAINTYGGAREECFCLYIGSSGRSDLKATGSIIEDCVVSDTRGDYHSALNLQGGGVMRGCQVFLPVFSDYNAQQELFGINVARANHLLVTSNYVEGGYQSVWLDTGPVTNLIILDNTFINPSQTGIRLARNTAASHLDGCVVSGNRIALNTRLRRAGNHHAGGIAVWQTDAQAQIRNLAFLRNTITGYTPNYRTTRAIALSAESPTTFYNVVVQHNNWDSAYEVSVKNVGNIDFYDNRDLDGRLISNVNQVAPRASRQRTARTEDGTIGLDEGYVEANSNKPITLTLPNIQGVHGTLIVISNEGRGQVTVTPASGQLLADSTRTHRSMPLANGATLMLLADGTNKWQVMMIRPRSP